jgi:diadenosine tetraphosphate (Ap4A) HIT family hydrolase
MPWRKMRANKRGHMTEECLLCAALANSASQSPQPCNRPIFETDLFTVMPAVGPLLPGHVMAVSKHHFPSLASMGELGIKGYLHLVDALRAKWPHLMVNVLETEHGGIGAVGPGPCVVHTHVNLLPNACQYANVLEGHLTLLNKTTDLRDLERVQGSYFFMKVESDVVVYTGANGQSQLVRRLIALAEGRDDWNWAIFSQDEWLDETNHMWR